MKHLLLMLILAIAIVSCNQLISTPSSNETFMEITSFTGEKIMSPDGSGEYLFYQEINWQITNSNAVASFAYRLETTDDVLPDEIETDDNGWILHGNSIWTTDTQFEINLQSINGTLKRIISAIEIKCIIDEVEHPAIQRDFRDDRLIGTSLKCSTGNIEDKITGFGLKFELNEICDDVFVDGFYADHFMYRINILNAADSTTIITEGDWHNTINLPDIRIIELNPTTTPALNPNNVGECTQFEAYIVTNTGYEDIDNSEKLHFFVSDQFHPSTVIYNQQQMSTNLVLGEHHYSFFNRAPFPYDYDLPMEYVEGKIHYACSFWTDLNEEFVCINSEDLKIFLNWGYSGEYQSNLPLLEESERLRDEDTNIYYYSEIKYYDIRIDGEPYDHPTLPLENNLFTDDNGTEWLRVPADHEIAGNLVLSNISDGTHILTVRAVDLQLVVDPSPEDLIFRVDPFIPHEDREGLLVIDGTPDNAQSSPEEYLDSAYSTENFLAGYSGSIDVIDHDQLLNYAIILNPMIDYIPANELQKYKTIIFYMDNPQNNSSIFKEHDVIDFYLKTGGNLILSTGANATLNLSNTTNNFASLIENYFGLHVSDENAVDLLSENIFSMRYFTHSISELSDYNDMHLLNPHFNSFVNGNPMNSDELSAFSMIAYINEEYLDEDTDIMYRFGCRPSGDEEYEPTEAEYNYYSNKVTGIRKITNNNKCYLFTSALGYLNPTDVNNTLLNILNEIENGE